MHQPTTPVKRHLAVLVVKNAAGEVLLQFRDGNPGIIHPLQWSLFGGHVEPGEDVRTAARRELEEELGLHITPGELDSFGAFELPGKHYDIFACSRVVEWADISLNEGAGCGFFNDDEIQRLQNVSPLVEWLRNQTKAPASTGA